MSHTRFDQLEGLRGVAAIAVLVQHCLEFTPLNSPTNDSGAAHVFQESFNLGRVGVIVFFLISGFLIPHSLKHGTRSLAKFAVSRFFRLYPLYWVSLAAALAIFPLLIKTDYMPLQIAANTTMVAQLFGQEYIISLYWTLFVEMLFYGLCAALFAMGLLHKRQFMARGLVVITLLAAGVVAAELALPPTKYDSAAEKLMTLGIYLLTMFAGYVLRMQYLREVSTRVTVLALVALAVLLGLYCVTRGQHGGYDPLLSPLSVATSTVLGFVVFLVVLHGNLLTQALWRWLGGISYGIYLFHAITLKIAVKSLAAPVETAGESVLLTGIVLVASIAVAAPLYWLVEQPMIEAGKKVRERLDVQAAKQVSASPVDVTL
jgi:peptidoglycan/LPS O-acetylase OafA/YrhL